MTELCVVVAPFQPPDHAKAEHLGERLLFANADGRRGNPEREANFLKCCLSVAVEAESALDNIALRRGEQEQVTGHTLFSGNLILNAAGRPKTLYRWIKGFHLGPLDAATFHAGSIHQ